jgi:DNA ligase D-like protein (predicted polymerase)
MLIRKNTKTFKAILEIISVCQSRADREKLVRLYITKAGSTIKERISVESIQTDTGLFYEMNYQAVLNNLQSSNHQLHVSDDIAGIYFFRTSSNKLFDETPFEFDEAIKSEFSSLPELPLVRKKEKADKFVFPGPTVKIKSPTPVKAAKKEKPTRAKVVEMIVKGPKQPNYKLKHDIHFSNLDKVLFRQPHVNKKDLLDYYDTMADNILPYLKDRPLSIRLHSDGGNKAVTTLKKLFQDNEDGIPDWFQKGVSNRDEDYILCPDKEHLLLYAEMGAIQFDAHHARIKSIDSPDYMLIAIDSPDSDISRIIDVVLVVREILEGLQLPSVLKTDGVAGLHIYIPLDTSSTFDKSKNAAAYICKLISLRIPDLITLTGLVDKGYGKVSLDYSINSEQEGLVAPYSLLVSRESPVVATPIEWDEVDDSLRAEDFTHETIFKRLKAVGDPFKSLTKKKVDVKALLKRLDDNYSFIMPRTV